MFFFFSQFFLEEQKKAPAAILADFRFVCNALLSKRYSLLRIKDITHYLEEDPAKEIPFQQTIGTLHRHPGSTMCN